MPIVSKSFYEDEVREGFYISSAMKRSWAAQMDMLETISDFCSIHEIKWFADFGTLLGAIRHKGFVPWDDDIDICMLREDYNRFIEVSKNGLPFDYELLEIRDENGEQFITIVSSTDIRLDKEYLERNHGCIFANSIDIFPKDADLNSHDYDLVEQKPFENISMNIPVGWDNILIKEYGDYMTVVKGSSDHNYPVFEKVEKTISQHIKYPYDFAFDSNMLGVTRFEGRQTDESNKRITIMPFSPKYWDTLESIWKEYKDAGYEVDVVPIPYYYRNAVGKAEEECFDISGYPEYIECCDYKSYNLRKIHPAKIIIQNPYDDMNYSTTVPTKFYSSQLVRFTGELIYIPYFSIDEIGDSKVHWKTMKYFCTVPGVVNADKTIVETEEMRQSYIDKLTSWSGEEYRHIWEKKIYIKLSI